MNAQSRPFRIPGEHARWTHSGAPSTNRTIRKIDCRAGADATPTGQFRNRSAVISWRASRTRLDGGKGVSALPFSPRGGWWGVPRFQARMHDAGPRAETPEEDQWKSFGCCWYWAESQRG